MTCVGGDTLTLWASWRPIADGAGLVDAVRKAQANSYFVVLHIC